MRETWYVLEGGAYADPADVAPDAAGVLRHRGGEAVALGPHGPRSRSMSAEEIEAARKPVAQPKADRQMKAKGGQGYETR